MANKRMFSLQIVDTDAFLDMPQSSQLLYFHLSMRADDEGFIGNPKKIIRLINANEDDFKILLAKRFVLSFESGVVVIKHWLIHNTIRMDRFNKTAYQDEKKSLYIKDNKAYTDDGNHLATNGIPSGNHLATQVKSSQVKISKVKISKVKISKDNILKDTKQSFGDPLINSYIQILKEWSGLSTLDGTVKENRRYAYLLRQNKIITPFKEKYQKEPTPDEITNALKAVLERADDFHRKNLTNFKYLYNNFGKIIHLNKKEGIIKI